MRRYDYDWDFYLLIVAILLFSLILFFEGQRKLNSIVSSTATLIEEKIENYQEKLLTTVPVDDIIKNENDPTHKDAFIFEDNNSIVNVDMCKYLI